MSFTTDSTIATFGGKLLKLSHESKVLGCKMNANLFLPPASTTQRKFPVLIFLAGLNCTQNNGAEKSFLSAHAAKKGIALLFPDTSPRGLGIQGEDDSWDFGSGAGFYIDATKEPYKGKYNMETYVTKELPEAVFAEFKELDSGRVSISGHSMGGHGALTLVWHRSLLRGIY
jgi:S-formylglutathione hydrolase